MMHGGLLAHQLFDRIDGVQAALPEVLVVPGVLADGDGQPQAVQLDHLLRPRRGEVALLVEDIVEGQQPLVLFEQQAAAIEQNAALTAGFTDSATGSAGRATPASTAVGKSRVAAASSSTAVRQRARKLGFSRKSAGG